LPCIVEFENIDIQDNVIIKSAKINRIWGVEYMLMDSKTFMGGTGGTEYLQIIDMFQKIWDINNCHNTA
jgi:hypothetical protein